MLDGPLRCSYRDYYISFIIKIPCTQADRSSPPSSLLHVLSRHSRSSFMEDFMSLRGNLSMFGCCSWIHDGMASETEAKVAAWSCTKRILLSWPWILCLPGAPGSPCLYTQEPHHNFHPSTHLRVSVPAYIRASVGLEPNLWNLFLITQNATLLSWHW